MTRSRSACLVVLALVLLLAAIFVEQGLSHAQGPLYPHPIYRFGVGLNREFGLITDYDVASLHVTWYSDWGASLNPLRPGGIEYVQLVRVPNGAISPPLSQLGPMVDANPGYLWIIGNEPECIWQDNCTPQQYAMVYHDLYAFIKGRDPSAQIAVGGVVQPTPLRLKWLDQVLDYYQTAYGQAMPVDVWNIHNQILQELKGGWGCEIPKGLTETSGRLYGIEDNDNINIFKQHIVDFRTWMRDRGQRDKPLIISEYGVLFPIEYGFTPERVNAFMDASFDYLLSAVDSNLGYSADENRLVQRWLWYSVNDQPWDPDTGKGFNGSLFDYRYPTYPGVITEMGINFREYTDALLTTSITLQQGSGGYSGCQDTYIYQYAPGTNYSTQNVLKVGYKQQYAGLIRFDLSSIPAGATVVSATLQLYATGWSGTNITFGAYGITRTVNHSQATWNVARTGQAWGLPGCNDTTTDRRPSPEATVTTSGINKWYGFNLKAIVQQWVNGSLANNGVLLRQTSSLSPLFQFASAQYGTVSLRPKLSIAYRAVIATPTPSPVVSPTPTRTPGTPGTATPTRTATATPYVNVAPKVGTVTPSSGSCPAGQVQTFTTSWSDGNGWQNLLWNWFHIGSSTAQANNVFLYYDADNDKLYLRNDAGSAWLGGYAPGSANTISNSQATVDCTQTTAVRAGTTVTVTWALTFKPAFIGAKNLYLKCKDDGGLVDGWTQKGTWTIAAAP